MSNMENPSLLDQGHVRLKRCRHGPMLYLVTDQYVGRSLDCYVYWHLPPLFNPQNYFGVEKSIFGRIVSVNMLAIPASVRQEVEGLHEITDPEDRWPGELRKVRLAEGRDESPAAPSILAVADSGGPTARGF
jgi:hypothetical protein